MRILQVIGGSQRGGSRTHLLTLCRGLRRRQEVSCVRIVCLTEGPVAEAARQAELPVDVIPMRGRGDLRAVVKLRRHLRRFSARLVHTHGVRANFVGRLAARGLPVASVSTVHSSPSHDYPSILRKWLFSSVERMTRGHVDAFIAVSETLRDELVEDGIAPERITVIPNTVAPLPRERRSAPARLRSELGLSADVPVLLTVGRLEPVKGHGTLIEALASVMKSSDAHAVIVGDGSQRRRLERRIAERGLGGRVHLLGFRSDVDSLMREATLLVSTSRMEGSPLVVLEAMAARLPVVVSAVGGMGEMVEAAGNGFAVPREDVRAIAGRIERLLRDPRLRRTMADRGAEALARDFSADAFLAEIWAVYQQVAHRSPPAGPFARDLAP